jgi:hypothetical protein
VSPVKYELGLYILEDDTLHSHRRGNLNSHIATTGWTLQWRRNVSPVKYELGFYILEDGILHSHSRANLNSYIALTGWTLQRRRNVSPVKYELGFISQETVFFIVTAVKPQILHSLEILLYHSVTDGFGPVCLYTFVEEDAFGVWSSYYSLCSYQYYHSHYCHCRNCMFTKVFNRKLPETLLWKPPWFTAARKSCGHNKNHIPVICLE